MSLASGTLEVSGGPGAIQGKLEVSLGTLEVEPPLPAAANRHRHNERQGKGNLQVKRKLT